MSTAAAKQAAPAALPAHNLDAEAAVLSAVLLKPAKYYDAAAVLGQHAFYADANRWIWRAFEALEAEGTAIDAVTVASWLRARDRFTQVGGAKYLAQIQDATPAVANIVDHARIIADAAHQRRLLATLRAFAAEGQGDVGAVGEWAQRVEQGVYEAARGNSVDDEDASLAAGVAQVIDDAQRQARGEQEAPGIATGFHGLDERIGGLKRAKTYIVAGRPGMGKSAFIGQIGTAIAARGMLVVEISTEQKRDELTRRKLAQQTRESYADIEAGNLSSHGWQQLMEAAERLRKLPLAIRYLVAPTITAIRSELRRQFARLRSAHGELPVGLIAIDQMGQLDAGHQRGESREAEIARLSRELSWMAGEFDCPMVIAAQLNRGCESRPDKKPILSDLRDSGSLEQDAYGVLFPFRAAYYSRDKNRDDAAPEACELIIAKHKNGPAKSVDFVFDGKSMSFDCAAPEKGYEAHPTLPAYDNSEEERRYR